MSPRKHKVSDEPSSSLSTQGKARDVLIGGSALLKELTKRLVQRALDARTADHLSYGEYTPEANASDDAYNGRSHKTPRGGFGELPIESPRSARRLRAIAHIQPPYPRGDFRRQDPVIVSTWHDGL